MSLTVFGFLKPAVSCVVWMLEELGLPHDYHLETWRRANPSHLPTPRILLAKCQPCRQTRAFWLNHWPS